MIKQNMVCKKSDDEKNKTEIMLEANLDVWIEDRFPAGGACLCYFAPVVTLDRNVFGGPTGGLAMELLTLIQWALEGKLEFTFRELEEK